MKPSLKHNAWSKENDHKHHFKELSQNVSLFGRLLSQIQSFIYSQNNHLYTIASVVRKLGNNPNVSPLDSKGLIYHPEYVEIVNQKKAYVLCVFYTKVSPSYC